jgi:hypothetical protein
MGLFSKDKKEEKEILRLPELPKLPELPEFSKMNDNRGLSPLPSFPKNSFGEKFSQNVIKDVVSGEKESDEEVNADEFSYNKENMQMTLKPTKKGFMSKETDFGGGNEYRQFQKFERRTLETPSGYGRKDEPIFVRLDKFEESLKIFEKIRNQILEIEGILHEIKNVKEHEEKELQFWEQEIQNIKKQIEKVDQDIFSRVE